MYTFRPWVRALGTSIFLMATLLSMILPENIGNPRPSSTMRLCKLHVFLQFLISFNSHWLLSTGILWQCIALSECWHKEIHVHVVWPKYIENLTIHISSIFLPHCDLLVTKCQLYEETGVPSENHHKAQSHWQLSSMRPRRKSRI